MGDRHRTRALLGFAGFGVFWGAWGAALPLVQDHAGAGDSALGLALLCIGAGALASMRPAGVLVDRAGPGVVPAVVACFALCSLLPALATSPIELGGALLLLGAASGAGTLLGALAPTPAVALVGVAVAGVGMSVCAPTLIGLAGRLAAPGERAGAVSAVTTIAYSGFLVGPAAVGLAAGATSLPAALAGVAGLAAVLAVGARVVPVVPRETVAARTPTR